MKTHLPSILLLLLFCVFATEMAAQSSPSPLISDYDNTSLPAIYQVGSDSAFCKAQTITIHGQNFKKATGGETWNATWVMVGTCAANVLSITTQSGGSNDHIVCQIPSQFIQDTCLRVRIVKRTIQWPDTFYYYAADTVCLIGDQATVSYASYQLCLGDTNPLPQVAILPNTSTGMFCCRTGATGFWVNPTTGEIPLHLGAVGPNNQFLFCTNHPECPDTVALAVSIQPRQASTATIQGQTLFTVCQGSSPISPDIPSPIGGTFHSNSGLVILNATTGQFSPSQSSQGLHSH